MTRRLLTALVLALGATSCSETATTPDPPTPPVTSFANRLPLGGAVSRSFITSQAGVITVTLKGTNPAGTSVGVGLGVPLLGLGNCGVTVSVNTSGSTQPQIQQSAAAGTYCVLIYDNGSLTAPVDFDATIVYPWE